MSLLASVTVKEEAVEPVRLTVPVAAGLPAFSAMLDGVIETVNTLGFTMVKSAALVAVPLPEVTAILPVVVPLGTVAVIFVVESTL